MGRVLNGVEGHVGRYNALRRMMRNAKTLRSSSTYLICHGQRCVCLLAIRLHRILRTSDSII